MTEAAFRKLALGLPDVKEGSHVGHADFRTNGKIFATLPFEGEPAAKDNVPGGIAVLKLTMEQQDALIEAWPRHFEPVKGGWGRRGYTRVLLRGVPMRIARQAIKIAWTNSAR